MTLLLSVVPHFTQLLSSFWLKLFSPGFKPQIAISSHQCYLASRRGHFWSQQLAAWTDWHSTFIVFGFACGFFFLNTNGLIRRSKILCTDKGFSGTALDEMLILSRD